MRLPQLGSVVWASLEDANGFAKLRPAVVVTATDDIDLGKTVRLAAVTTRLPEPLPDDHVLLSLEHHFIVVAQQRHQAAALFQLDQEIDGSLAVDASIHVVAERHNRIAGLRRDGREQRSKGC